MSIEKNKQIYFLHVSLKKTCGFGFAVKFKNLSLIIDALMLNTLPCSQTVSKNYYILVPHQSSNCLKCPETDLSVDMW